MLCFERHARDSIHTENACKFSVDEFPALAAQAGMTHLCVWQDDDTLFGIHCQQPV